MCLNFRKYGVYGFYKAFMNSLLERINEMKKIIALLYKKNK